MRSLFAGIALLCLAAKPCGAQPVPDIADIAVAHIDDLGMPFDLKANLYLPSQAAQPVPLLTLYSRQRGKP